MARRAMPTGHAAVALATAACLCTVLFLRRRRRAKDRETPASADDASDGAAEEVRIPLMPHETSSIMMSAAASVSAVTFFEGHHERAAEYLRTRIGEIEAVNPWLGGRLERRAADGDRPSLYYRRRPPPSDDDAGPAPAAADSAAYDESGIFSHVDAASSPLARSTPYAKMARSVLRYLVKKGSETVGRPDEPQFRVSVVPDAEYPDERWALVVSLSHVLADGHTFYRIHNMLSDDADVAPLSAVRKPHVMDAAASAMGGTDEAAFLGRPKPGLLVSLAASTVAGKILGPNCAVAVYALDEDYVAKSKREMAESAGVTYASTNDIITSSMCRATGCDVGTMDVNFRGRLPGTDLTEDDAGNYEDKIVYRARDFDTPALIRKSIPPGGPLRRAALDPPTSLPRTVREFWDVRMITMVSNWSTFAKGVDLVRSCGSTEDVHLPLFDPADVPVRGFTGCFVFRAGADLGEEGGRDKPRKRSALGLAVAGRPDVLEAIERSGLVRGRIVA